MLVLSRRPDEEIVFPNLGIRIRVLRLSTSQAKLGIEAPPQVQVLRAELAAARMSVTGRPPDLDNSEEVVEQFRERLLAASNILQRIHELTELQSWEKTEPMILSMFRELKLMDEAVGRLLMQNKSPDPSRKRALLVDDNRNETRLLGSYLRLKRFDVDTAGDGADAMHYLTKNRIPDVMVLDMNMPRFNGRWTVEKVRANPKLKGLRIFAVSGVHPAEYGVEIGNNGVDRWLQKPLDPDRLVQEILQTRQQGAVPA